MSDRGAGVGPNYRPELPFRAPEPPRPLSGRERRAVKLKLGAFAAVLLAALLLFLLADDVYGPPEQDVRIDSCTLSEKDPRVVLATGTVRNPGQVISYRITVALVAADGTRLDTSDRFVAGVKYKQTKHWQRDLIARDPVAPGFTCRIVAAHRR